MRRFFLSLLFLLAPLSMAHAQLVPDTSDIVVDVAPETPEPGQNTTISLRSYSTDLNKATIVWLVDNKAALTGTGETTFSFTAPKTGKSILTVRVQTEEKVRIEKKLTFAPTNIDLVWESDGYLPPFFKGRSYFTRQASVKITAIPNFFDKAGKRIDPKNLVYTWKSGSDTLGSKSGYGKQSLTLTAGIIERPFEVSVVVSTLDGTTKGEQSISLSPENAQAVLYEDSPIYGTLYNKAVTKNYSLSNAEVKFVAVPYYFTSASRANGALKYTWTINDDIRDDLSNAWSLTLRRKGDTEGQSAIGLRIDNTTQMLQTASTDFAIKFNKSATSTPSF